MNKNIKLSIKAWNNNVDRANRLSSWLYPCANDSYNLANRLGTLSGYHLCKRVSQSVNGMFDKKITEKQVTEYCKINHLSIN